MARTLSDFIGRLGDTQRALLALSFVATLTAAIVFGITSFVGLPARVSAIEKEVVELEKTDIDTNLKLDRIICMLSLPDDMTNAQRISRCP